MKHQLIGVFKVYILSMVIPNTFTKFCEVIQVLVSYVKIRLHTKTYYAIMVYLPPALRNFKIHPTFDCWMPSWYIKKRVVSYDLRDANLIQPKPQSTTYGLRWLLYLGTRLWNNLAKDFSFLWETDYEKLTKVEQMCGLNLDDDYCYVCIIHLLTYYTFNDTHLLP